ncbi:MAG: AAA family ATPase [Planctomycetota bacterium]|nr:AAA family ATPase [Planctomycetota bacterium]MDA1137680.1 AAA family ATPase [Planctomycetota bacterium]
MPDLSEILEHIKPATQRIKNLREALCSLFVGKDEIIRLLCLCSAAREPLLLVGEPGTAKSDLIVQFCELLGIQREKSGGYFEFLLTPFTEPSEVFGPVKIEEYTKNQIYSRNSTGMLQNAEVAFLDEVFKANSAILNSLLTILNERKFYDAGKPIPVPLLVLFGATNEVPSTDDLGALFDRFTLRVECRNVSSEDDLKGLVRLGIQRESLRSRRMVGEGATVEFEQMPSLDDFNSVFKAVTRVLQQEDFQKKQVLFLQSFIRKVRAIRDDRLTQLNDRKVIKMIKLMVTSALLEGRDLKSQDQRLLEYTWDNPYDVEGRRRLSLIAREE